MGDLDALLRQRFEELEHQLEELIRQRQQTDAAIFRIEEEQRHISQLLGLGEAYVRDDAVADLVVQLLRETGPLHYVEIERQLRLRGWYRAGGKKPASTLLARYFDDPRLYRPRRGIYAVRPDDRIVVSAGVRKKRIR